jgi:aspartyl protease family protein
VTISRLAILVGIVVFAAIMVPSVAPDLISGIVGFRDTVVEPKSIEASAPVRRVRARQVALDADPRGHFISTARINGRSVEIMVDTGASIVALNADTARHLRILPPKSAFNASINTASGVVDVAPVVLSEIRLGDVTIRDVGAVIVPGNALGINLLGMSFLGRLSGFQVENGELILTQ